MKVKGNLERLFDKNLNDLVRGIRNHKDDEAKYIATCLEEIKQELRQHNTAVKANAVQKLTYLQMCGYDISWAGFNIIGMWKFDDLHGSTLVYRINVQDVINVQAAFFKKNNNLCRM